MGVNSSLVLYMPGKMGSVPGFSCSYIMQYSRVWKAALFPDCLLLESKMDGRSLKSVLSASRFIVDNTGTSFGLVYRSISPST